TRQGFVWAAVLATVGASAGEVSSPIRVQVNQVALEASGPKGAVVEYTGKLTGGRYTIVKDGKPVQSGTLTALPQFTEWGAGKKYFAIDFSSAQVAGRY